MLPVFLQHLSPPVGACGERNYALFFAASGMLTDCKKNCDNTSELAVFFHQKRAGVTTRQIWRMMAPPQKALKRTKNGPCSDLGFREAEQS